MSAEIQKLQEDLQGAVALMRENAETYRAQAEKFGEAESLVKEADERLQGRINELEDELREITKAALRTGNGGGQAEAKAAEMVEYEKAFDKYLRKGNENGLNDLEAKALSVQNDPDGGYTVTPAQGQLIMGKIFESSPVRQVATVTTISTDAIEHLVDKDEASGGGWVSETGARAQTGTPEFAQLRIPVHEQYEMPFATQKLLDDTSFNIEEWLANKVGDKMARRENQAYVKGDGNGKPRGFTTYPAGTSWGQIEQVNSGAAATLTPDGLISLIYKLKGPYRQGATFAMNRTTVGVIRKLADANSQYLWQPGLAGQPSTLLGYPIAEFEDMADVASNSLSVAFGNFRVGYEIVDRQGIRVLRDPYSNKPHIAFYTTRRTGGDVTVFEAIKLQKTAS